MRITVLHRDYGCETGCCGHVIEIDGKRTGKFHFFEHPDGGDYRKFAQELIEEELGEEHVKDLDWNNCLIVDD